MYSHKRTREETIEDEVDEFVYSLLRDVANDISRWPWDYPDVEKVYLTWDLMSQPDMDEAYWIMKFPMLKAYEKQEASN